MHNKEDETVAQESEEPRRELKPFDPSPVAVQRALNLAQVESPLYEIQVKQTEALANLAEGVKTLAAFVTGGGLQQLLQGYSKAQSVQGILNGLAAHDGRNALDARVIKQNAIEITQIIESCYDKFAEVLSAKQRGEVRDPDIKDAEADYAAWKERNEPVGE